MATSFGSTDYAFNANQSLPANAALGIFSAQSYSTSYGTGGDDTAAIQAAINAAVSAGGAVAFLPPPSVGYLTISSTLILGANGTCLVGASPSVKIKVKVGANLDWALSTGVSTSVDYRTVFAVNSRVINLGGTNYTFYDITRPVGLSVGGGVYNVTFVGDATQTVGLGLGIMLNAASGFTVSNTNFSGFVGEDVSLWDCYNTTVVTTAVGSAGPSIGVHRACYDTSIVTATSLGATATPYRVYAEQYTVVSVTTTYSPIYTKFVDCHAYCATLQPEAYDIAGAAFVNLTGCTGDNVTNTLAGSTRFGIPSIDVLSDVGALSGVASVTAGTGLTNTGTASNPVINLGVPVPVADGGTGLTATGSVGQILYVSAAGVLSYENPPASGVTSVNAAAPITTTGGTTPTIGFVAPGTSGNVLTSTGSGWVSSAAAASGGPAFGTKQMNFANSTTSSSFTNTFPATATAGNTIMIAISTDASVTPTVTGYTKIAESGNGSSGFGHVIVYIKTAAGTETGVTYTFGAAAQSASLIFEIVGTRSLDVTSNALSAAGGYFVTLPLITPAANSMVFAFGAFVSAGSGAPSILAPANWTNFFLQDTSNRQLVAAGMSNAGTGVAPVTGIQLNYGNMTPFNGTAQLAGLLVSIK